MRCSGAVGFITSYKTVLGAETKAKTVTNLLILLSVLWLVLFRSIGFFNHDLYKNPCKGEWVVSPYDICRVN
jgi:hypothetical protein